MSVTGLSAPLRRATSTELHFTGESRRAGRARDPVPRERHARKTEGGQIARECWVGERLTKSIRNAGLRPQQTRDLVLDDGLAG